MGTLSWEKPYETQQNLIFKWVVDVASRSRKCVVRLIKYQLSVVDDLMQITLRARAGDTSIHSPIAHRCQSDDPFGSGCEGQTAE